MKNFGLQMDVTNVLIIFFYLIVGCPLLYVNFDSRRHTDCYHAQHYAFERSLHLFAYGIHGLVWTQTGSNFGFFITLLMYYYFNMECFESSNGYTAVFPLKLLIITLSVYGVYIWFEYSTILGLLSAITQGLSQWKIIQIHYQCSQLKY